MAYAARLQNQQSRELARIYAEEYDAAAVRVSWRFLRDELINLRVTC